jgi:SAM-dependent methyltransferase
MLWVKNFYEKQNEWLQAYLGPIEEQHYRRAWMVQELAGLCKGKKILELGGGGGQTALALASLGFDVTMVELLEKSCEHATSLSEARKGSSIHIICADFYEIELEEKYDFVLYFDSFGIGSDDDQIRLLDRISSWLKPQGTAIIEVGNPSFFIRAKGFSMEVGEGIYRTFDFDAEQFRFLDYWYQESGQKDSYFQSLRTYSLIDFKLLLSHTNLHIDQISLGGTIDFENQIFLEKAEMDNAMTYFTYLKIKQEC